MIRKITRRAVCFLALAFSLVVHTAPPAQAEDITILMATVTYDGHVVTSEGQKLFLTPSEAAVQLGQYQGKQVIVTGMTGECDGRGIFSVTSFQPVPEKADGADAEKSDD
ncbi:hypothetical protein [Desulfatiglans anilini]|uniref:hypothetical protein n=1 Tax=Desulfatiglans anilini TaxID=90728 RepID=UPI0004108CF7|nr:hypothetical protein [Desulfatiglans anilini]